MLLALTSLLIATATISPALSATPEIQEAAAASPAASVATRLSPPKRRPDEAIGAFSEPSVSGEWLTVRSAAPAFDLPGALHIYRRTAQVQARTPHFNKGNCCSCNSARTC